MSNDRIEKQIELKAPVSRVWRALTDHREFGEWFRVKIDGPFVSGQTSTGHMTYPGYEHVQWNSVIKEIQPERYFSFNWHPAAIDPAIDYSTETPTLVEFTLEETKIGTLLRVVESGFENIPSDRRLEAFRMDEGGWESQLENIENYVTNTP
ncbi:MAG: SRPBCC family protein [Capsulimonas sp.]|uniref:SRPBCC family protein n=1 Tax=Capsulimonas sp. TaxID=2494211 RepID=UPI0032678852